MRKNILFCLYALLLFTASCANIKPDGSLSAVDAGYPTAEFRACGKLWHGIGVCSLTEGSDLSKIDFKVQGYYKGTVKVDSVNCGGSQAIRYVDSQLVDNILSGTPELSCVVTISVNPEFPNQQHQSLVVNGLRGYLSIRLIPAERSWEGYVLKEAGEWKRAWKIYVGESDPVRVSLIGCGKKFDSNITPDATGYVSVPMDVVLAEVSPQVCLMEGIIISQNYQNKYLSAVIALYQPAYTLLPVPVLKISGNKLSVSGDSTVSVISLDEDYKLASTGAFKFDSTKYHVFRAITIKGRTVLAEYTPTTKVFRWIQ